MKIDETIGLAFMGFALSAVSHIAEMLAENKCKEHTRVKVVAIILTKSFLGACVALVVFYGLTDFLPNTSVELRLGVSAFCAFFSESISFYALNFLRKKVENV
jgi:hypothetical protein